MTTAIRDQNHVPVGLGVSSTDSTVTLPLTVSSATGRLMTDSAGGGSGDVVGPAFSTDNAVVRFDGTTGQLIQDSGILVDDSNVVFPATSDAGTLGSTTKMWSDLFLASGAVINYNNGNVVLTHSAGILTMGTGELRVTTVGTNTASVITVGSTSTLTNKTLTGPVINAGTIGTSLVPTSDDGAALGDTTHNFSDLFLATGAVINYANGNVVLTHSSGILTMGTGELRITTVGTNAASVITVGSTSTLTNKTLTAPVLNAGTVGTSLVPTSDDGAALGDTTHNFSDLFLATGAVINYANGNVVLTHSSGIITMGTGEMRITTAGTNAASVITVGSTSTLTNKTLTSPVINTGTIGTSLVPTSNDGAALGNTTNQFSDLFLAEGGVINWDNGDATVTQTNNTIAWAGIDTFNVGTGTSVGLGTIELGAATDTTIARVSAGVVSIESVNIVTVSSTDTLTNKTLTAPKLASGGFIADANGNEGIILVTTASAVNEVTVTNAATGTAGPLIAASGETNVDLRIAGKGTGKVHRTSSVYGDITAYSPSAAATATLTLNTSNLHTITMPAGNITIALSNESVGQCFLINIIQDSTGSRTVTWFTTIKWAGGSAPTLTTTANKIDTLGFIVTSAGNYQGYVVGQNL